MNIYRYPVLYFMANGDIINPDNFDMALKLEQHAGKIKGITDNKYGFKLDFNGGLRLEVPPGDWRVRITDADTELVVLDQQVSEKTLVSMEKYFVKWRVEIFSDTDKVFEHLYNPKDRTVCFNFLVDALGEKIMLLPYIRAFVKKYGCRAVCSVNKSFSSILERYYPEVELVPLSETMDNVDSYAAYNIGTFLRPSVWTPWGAGVVPYHMIGEALLGLDGRVIERHQFTSSAPPPVTEPYVCIAVQSSGAAKCWLYPGGWDEVVAYLHKLGYKVLCIDRDKTLRYGDYELSIPAGAEDFTGNRPLTERIDVLCHAEFFIGLSSGLSWVADACGIKTVIISGLTMPYIEFPATARVINHLVCHGCYSDSKVDWKEKDCPHHIGTEREYECAKKITPGQVIKAIDYVRSAVRPEPKYF